MRDAAPRPGLGTVVLEWGRIGCVGFGGPPAHIALLRELCVRRRGWLEDGELEDAIAACGLLPGPASTQLAIYCGWRVRGAAGALAGGLAFILPGLLTIIALAAVFLASVPPDWVRGAGAGAGAAVAPVVLYAGLGLVPASWARTRGGGRAAWVAYAAAGVAAAAVAGSWVVLVLLGCGVAGIGARRLLPRGVGAAAPWALAAAVPALPGLVWVAFKVGALAYGGGFVIVPLMQTDAVERHRWLTDAQFLNAVALGQVTPGPVTHTVAVVGYGAAGIGGAALAAAVAFAPSFAFVLAGVRHFDAVRRDATARAFLAGAGPAAIGAILGSAAPLVQALDEPWQLGVAGAAAVVLLSRRAGVVATLLAAGAAGLVVALAGGPLPG